MQGDHLESQGASELEVNRFKEAVCVSKLMPQQGTKPMPIDAL